MNEPRWIHPRAALLLHAEGLAECGGPAGIRDLGLLESALARPRNLFLDEKDVDLARLAACYAVGLAKNLPFLDDIERAAFLALGLFLALNGRLLVAEQLDAVRTVLAVATGELSEQELAGWIRRNIAPR